MLAIIHFWIAELRELLEMSKAGAEVEVEVEAKARHGKVCEESMLKGPAAKD